MLAIHLQSNKNSLLIHNYLCHHQLFHIQCLLKQSGHVAVDKDGFLTLTKLGRETAEKIYERHTVLRDMLIHLGVSEEVASADACRIEHVISDASFEAICRHIGSGRA